MITYRRRVASDYPGIAKLIYEIFGILELDDALGGIENGRYLLALDGKEIIALCGINESDYYNSLEVDYVGTKKEYRNQGIMTWLFEHELDRVGEDIDVYCSCWGMYDRDVNLKHIMKRFGFELVTPHAVTVSSNYRRNCEFCIEYRKECYCREDLYLRKGYRMT